MSLNTFETHLHDPAPGFRCHLAGKDDDFAFTAKLVHQVGKPSGPAAISKLKRIFPKAPASLVNFYKLHDGMYLYRDTRPEFRSRSRYAAAVLFYPIDAMEKQTQAMRAAYEEGFLVGPDEPGRLSTGIAFAEIFQSDNFFVFYSGKIYYCDHDGYSEKLFAKDFESFLKLIYSDPAGFLDKCGCYTRYSDGKTKAQWIPKVYVSDITKLK
jgi:hypothetical protein